MTILLNVLTTIFFFGIFLSPIIVYLERLAKLYKKKGKAFAAVISFLSLLSYILWSTIFNQSWTYLLATIFISIILIHVQPLFLVKNVDKSMLRIYILLLMYFVAIYILTEHYYYNNYLHPFQFHGNDDVAVKMLSITILITLSLCIYLFTLFNFLTLRKMKTEPTDYKFLKITTTQLVSFTIAGLLLSILYLSTIDLTGYSDLYNIQFDRILDFINVITSALIIPLVLNYLSKYKV